MAKNQTNNSTNRTTNRTTDTTQKTTNRTQQKTTNRTTNATDSKTTSDAGFLRLPPLGGSCRPQAADEGRPCHYNPLPGKLRRLFPHPPSGGASATFPFGGRLLLITPAYTRPTSR